jgi:hypothetical protein
MGREDRGVKRSRRAKGVGRWKSGSTGTSENSYETFLILVTMYFSI